VAPPQQRGAARARDLQHGERRALGADRRRAVQHPQEAEGATTCATGGHAGRLGAEGSRHAEVSTIPRDGIQRLGGFQAPLRHGRGGSREDFLLQPLRGFLCARRCAEAALRQATWRVHRRHSARRRPEARRDRSGPQKEFEARLELHLRTGEDLGKPL
jgi:hypothetical protein